VEDSSTLVALGLLGCDNAQGYLIKRPCPADELTPWLQSESRHGSRAA
jgi:EAL domain-containing protein (putative c-di-GMP-specific phosphodiesterase class I)